MTKKDSFKTLAPARDASCVAAYKLNKELFLRIKSIFCFIHPFVFQIPSTLKASQPDLRYAFLKNRVYPAPIL